MHAQERESTECCGGTLQQLHNGAQAHTRISRAVGLQGMIHHAVSGSSVSAFLRARTRAHGTASRLQEAAISRGDAAAQTDAPGVLAY